MRLAARLGVADVDGMLAGMSVLQFAEWQAFLRMEGDPAWIEGIVADLSKPDPDLLRRRLAERKRRLQVKRSAAARAGNSGRTRSRRSASR